MISVLCAATMTISCAVVSVSANDGMKTNKQTSSKDVNNGENHQQKQSKIQNNIINNDQIKEKNGIIKYVVIDLKNKQRHGIIEKEIVMSKKI